MTPRISEEAFEYNVLDELLANLVYQFPQETIISACLNYVL